MIVGDNPQAKMQHIHAILSPLMKHLTQKHQAELQWTQLMGGEYAGLLAMNFFETHAPQVEAQRDYARWKIHTLTRRSHVTDQRIAEKLRAVYSQNFYRLTEEAPPDTPQRTRGELEQFIDLWMETPFAQALAQMIRDMRDVLTERDRYQMTDPPPKMPEPQNRPPEPSAA